MTGQGLAREERLRDAQRVDELFARGAVGKTRLVLVRALPNGGARTRMAVLVGKVAGNPVKRNRLRRRLRAAFRTHKQELPAGLDLAVLPRRGALTAAFEELVPDLMQAVERAVQQLPDRPPAPEVEGTA